MAQPSVTAAERWRELLAQWAIPPQNSAGACDKPERYPAEMFACRADLARDVRTPANQAALAALPPRGSILDVGCGAGAASLPLADRAGTIIGVDPSPEMLDAFVQRLRPAGVRVEAIQDTWEAAASRAPLTDVVVCHNLAYLVPDLQQLVRTLSAHARARVVLELTERHPLTWLNELWRQFHGTDRPSRPTADDAASVLAEEGIDAQRATWASSAYGQMTYFRSHEDLVAWVRRRLYLPRERDADIAAALAGRIAHADGRFGFPPRNFVGLWWDTQAPLDSGRAPDHDFADGRAG